MTRTSTWSSKRIAKLAGQFGTARVMIEGHTDSSMKGRAPESLVKELSEQPSQRRERSA